MVALDFECIDCGAVVECDDGQIASMCPHCGGWTVELESAWREHDHRWGRRDPPQRKREIYSIDHWEGGPNGLGNATLTGDDETGESPKEDDDAT